MCLKKIKNRILAEWRVVFGSWQVQLQMTCWHVFAMCRRWRVVILQHTSHIHNPAGRRAPAPAEKGELLPSSGDVSGLKGSPHHPATGGLWAQWENEDLCTPLNPQEFLIKHRSRSAEGPLGPHPPSVRGLPLWQGEWSSPLHFVLAVGYQGLLFTFPFLTSTRTFSQSGFQSPQDFLFFSFRFYISVCVASQKRERHNWIWHFLMVSWDIFVWRHQSRNEADSDFKDVLSHVHEYK